MAAARVPGAFNRTSLELKLVRGVLQTDVTVPFNRTSLELKLMRWHQIRKLDYPFNRTSLELKPVPAVDTQAGYRNF